MTIKQILQKYPLPETELLLGGVLKQSKEFLYLHPEQKLTIPQSKRFQKLMAEFKTGVPVAYLLGHKDFYGLRFKVNSSTLIPRPESEWLVERALEILKSKKSPQVIDIGTGSGCLAVSVKKNLPKAKVTATDIYSKTLAIAKDNAATHKVTIKFQKQDLLQSDTTKYDLIMANLPYVPARDYQRLQSNLRHEPKSALVDKHGDLSLYKKLLGQASNHLKSNGIILLEIDPTMKPHLENWRKKNLPRVNFTFTRDMHRLWRFCEIRI